VGANLAWLFIGKVHLSGLHPFATVVKEDIGKPLSGTGLPPWNESKGKPADNDIWQHIGGESTVRQTTPYISWTTSFDVAKYYALKNAEYSKDCRGCVWILCADDGDPFWKNAKTPKEWGKEQGNPNPPDVGEITSKTLNAEKEVTSKGRVPYKYIRGYQPVWRKDCCEKNKVTVHGKSNISRHCCPKQARNEAVTGKSP